MSKLTMTFEIIRYLKLIKYEILYLQYPSQTIVYLIILWYSMRAIKIDFKEYLEMHFIYIYMK